MPYLSRIKQANPTMGETIFTTIVFLEMLVLPWQHLSPQLPVLFLFEGIIMKNKWN
jgi:hypothetical protein